MIEGMSIGKPPAWMRPRRDGSIEFDLQGVTPIEGDRRLTITQLWQAGWRPLVPDEREAELSDLAESVLGPFVRDSETSRQAALAAYPRQGSQRRRIISRLAWAGGATREELAAGLALSENTVRPRVKELIDGGWVQDSGRRRSTSSGQPAVVLELTEQARKREEEECR